MFVVELWTWFSIVIEKALKISGNSFVFLLDFKINSNTVGVLHV